MFTMFNLNFKFLRAQTNAVGENDKSQRAEKKLTASTSFQQILLPAKGCLKYAEGQVDARVKGTSNGPVQGGLHQRRRFANSMELQSSSGSDDTRKRTNARMSRTSSSLHRPPVPAAKTRNAQRGLASKP